MTTPQTCGEISPSNFAAVCQPMLRVCFSAFVWKTRREMAITQQRLRAKERKIVKVLTFRCAFSWV